MARYIDVEKLIYNINDKKTVSFWAKREMLKWVEEEYAVNAVEVVRCKDCKYWKTHGCRIDFQYFSETNRDDFCSYGEKKEGC